MSKPVIIIGGYGVFGGRLAMALAADPRLDVIVAGRDLAKAAAFCAKHGGRAMTVDISTDRFGEAIAAEAPFIVIDAAGPFQAYGDKPCRVAEAAINCGAHYLDLSDDTAFTQAIRNFDTVAKARGVAVLSGVSSVPALSSAVVESLARDFKEIHLIETVILPGNRAPRGLSVVRSIVGQAGRPLTVWRGGRHVDVAGWGDCTRVELSAPGAPPLEGRWASFIGAPDLALFPQHYGARSVLFRAGLDLKLLHGGLALLSGLVRVGFVKSLSPLTPQLKWIADRLERFGSDRGGMRVRVAGVSEAGKLVQRTWTLIAEAGDGPHIPAVPARVVCAKLLAGEITPGARACVGEFKLDEAQAFLSGLHVVTHEAMNEFSPVFADVLGQNFARLPQQLRDLHTVIDVRHWAGKAEIERGKGFVSRLVGAIFGFPPAGRDIAVRVEMQRSGSSEVWMRDFGGICFRSRLMRGGPSGSGRIRERFGPLSFEIALQVHDRRLAYPVRRGTCLGIPLPRFLLPISETYEYVDDQGRAHFEVTIAMPLVGHIVSYSGWLKAADYPMTPE